MTASLYPAGFYENRRAHTSYAARCLLGALPAELPRTSVADIGCGTGTWLAAALSMDSQSAFGIEGDWVTNSMLDDPRIDFRPHDLEQRFTGPRVDFAISLEVAEHLSPERAESFVADLVALAPAILFSAAIPGQGGVGHRNERWHSYWAELFSAKGYTAHDIIRPIVWADDAIPAWYRQNAILYLDDASRRALALTPADPTELDRVHPSFWERANRELRYANALPESEVLRRQAEQAQQ
jgi:SAM-dependent methyltransferase